MRLLLNFENTNTFYTSKRAI